MTECLPYYVDMFRQMKAAGRAIYTVRRFRIETFDVGRLLRHER